jgi:hypothetical protein
MAVATGSVTPHYLEARITTSGIVHFASLLCVSM